MMHAGLDVRLDAVAARRAHGLGGGYTCAAVACS